MKGARQGVAAVLGSTRTKCSEGAEERRPGEARGWKTAGVTVRAKPLGAGHAGCRCGAGAGCAQVQGWLWGPQYKWGGTVEGTKGIGGSVWEVNQRTWPELALGRGGAGGGGRVEGIHLERGRRSRSRGRRW